MDRDAVKGLLAKYSPPLSPGQMDEIAEAVMAEWSKAEAQLKAQLKQKSKSQSVAVSKRG